MFTKRFPLTVIASLVLIAVVLLARGASSVQASRPNDDRSNASSSSSSSSTSGEIELYGAVEAIGSDSLTVNGQVIRLTTQTEIKSQLAVGDQVKLHLYLGEDGSLTAREVEHTQTGVHAEDRTQDQTRTHSSDDGPLHDLNDDHGGDQHRSGDDHDTDDHSSDDHQDDNSGHGRDH